MKEKTYYSGEWIKFGLLLLVLSIFFPVILYFAGALLLVGASLFIAFDVPSAIYQHFNHLEEHKEQEESLPSDTFPSAWVDEVKSRQS